MVEKQKLFELAQRNTFAKQIGIELTDVEEGYAKGRIRLAQENMNVYGGDAWRLRLCIGGYTGWNCSCGIRQLRDYRKWHDELSFAGQGYRVCEL